MTLVYPTPPLSSVQITVLVYIWFVEITEKCCKHLAKVNLKIPNDDLIIPENKSLTKT